MQILTNALLKEHAKMTELALTPQEVSHVIVNLLVIPDQFAMRVQQFITYSFITGCESQIPYAVRPVEYWITLLFNYNNMFIKKTHIIDIDECTTIAPCQNGGSCFNTDGSYTCDCTATGYTGTNCDNGMCI